MRSAWIFVLRSLNRLDCRASPLQVQVGAEQPVPSVQDSVWPAEQFVEQVDPHSFFAVQAIAPGPWHIIAQVTAESTNILNIAASVSFGSARRSLTIGMKPFFDLPAKRFRPKRALQKSVATAKHRAKTGATASQASRRAYRRTSALRTRRPPGAPLVLLRAGRGAKLVICQRGTISGK
jgi:hypothetical protein